MSGTTKVSFNLDNDLLIEVSKLMRAVPNQKQTQVLNNLIHKGLSLEEEIKKLKRKEDYVLLKTLHIMRSLASSRNAETLEIIDATFQNELEEMKEMIYEEGIDYVNG